MTEEVTLNNFRVIDWKRCQKAKCDIISVAYLSTQCDKRKLWYITFNDDFNTIMAIVQDSLEGSGPAFVLASFPNNQSENVGCYYI